jgi:hypothetical protein
MKRVTTIATACVAATLLALSVSAGAQDFNSQERTFLTFSNSVELPGMTLPAGTYTFKLADTPGRNVVQVLSQDEKEIHGQFLFVQAQRPEVTGETVVTFRETREGSTPAVQYWYYPGEKIGKEFIYPKDQAMRISQRTGMEVRTEEGLISANATASSTNPQGQVTEWKREETTAAAAAGAQVEAPSAAADAHAQPADVSADTSLGNTRDDRATGLALEPSAQQQSADANRSADADRIAEVHQNAPVPGDAASNDTRPVGTSGQAEATVAQNDAPAELPRTASPLALTGLLGLLSLAGAAGVRSFRR